MKSLLGLISLLLFEQAAYGEDGLMLMLESPAERQLENYAKSYPNGSEEFATTVSGIVFPTLTASLKVGPQGPVLLQDRFLIERLQLFNRERIPERVAHAKGTGAFGYFQVTNDISKYTKADFLQPRKRTRVAARFSTASGELGSADTAFDVKGFSVKFYTEDGNYDFTGLNFPIFDSRDPILFPDLNRVRKRNPQTNLPDTTASMDLVSQRPEMTFFLLYYFSDMGNPKSYRCMKGFGIHAYKMVNSDGNVVYVKFHWTPHEKEEFYTFDEAIQMTGNNPNVLTQDLFDNIAKKNYPKWTLSIQVMTLEQAAKHPYNPFDTTKLWKIEDFPLIPVGEMILDENPQNFFSQIEQLAFSPGNMVRGIEAGPDAVLQARMFAYTDAQLHRLGTNFASIPVNSCPFARSYHRDGLMPVGTNGGSGPNYYPNTFNGPRSNDNKSYKQSVFHVSGDVDRIDVIDGDDFSQPTDHWVNNIGAEEKKRIVYNIAQTLKKAAPRLRKKFLDNIAYKLHKDFGDGIKAGL